MGVYESGVGGTIYVNGPGLAGTVTATGATKETWRTTRSMRERGFDGTRQQHRFPARSSTTCRSTTPPLPRRMRFSSPTGDSPTPIALQRLGDHQRQHRCRRRCHFDGNPDIDPFGNALEWVLGGDLPFDSMADLLDPKATDLGLTFTFTREDASEGEVDLAVERSTDLFDTDNNSSLVPPPAARWTA